MNHRHSIKQKKFEKKKEVVDNDLLISILFTTHCYDKRMWQIDQYGHDPDGD